MAYDKRFIFVPQVTIQFPLRHTVDICYSLFYDNYNAHRLARALPFAFAGAEKNTFLKLCDDKKTPLFRTDIGGLMFLQASTISNMAYEVFGIEKNVLDVIEAEETRREAELSESQNIMDKMRALQLHDSDVDISELSKKVDIAMINKTYKNFLDKTQFDAKGNISYMSRRPFSEMLKETQQNAVNKAVLADFNLSSPITSYASFFCAEMTHNPLFSDPDCEIPKLFGKANYAEQFFHEGKPIDFSRYNVVFDREFYEHSNTEGQFDSLLKNGIISTAMIRHLNMPTAYPFGQHYYTDVITSIENPSVRPKLTFTGDYMKIESEPWSYDLLSPPFPLAHGMHKITHPQNQDAMGAYNLNHQVYRTSEFGSAIVEFRDIKSVSKGFRERYGIECEQGDFLSYSERLTEQALALFYQISNIDNQDILQYSENMIYATAEVE